jgi:hypothetical protein
MKSNILYAKNPILDSQIYVATDAVIHLGDEYFVRCALFEQGIL